MRGCRLRCASAKYLPFGQPTTSATVYTLAAIRPPLFNSGTVQETTPIF